MPWKMKDNVIVVENGNPVWLTDDGSEKIVNGGEVLGKITQLTAEAAQHRKDKEAAQAIARAFEGIDATAAKDALDKVSKIDQGQLIAAGKVDEVKNQITNQFKTELEKLKTENGNLSGQLKNALIGNAFANSPVVKDKFIVPPDMLQKMFGDRLDVREGRIVALDATGSPMKSMKNFGQDMDFDEAFQSIIDAYPGKDAIMRGANHNGSGGAGGGAGGGGKKRVTRAEEAALPVAQKVALAQEVREGKAELVD